jgi:hypothetical protein
MRVVYEESGGGEWVFVRTSSFFLASAITITNNNRVNLSPFSCKKVDSIATQEAAAVLVQAAMASFTRPENALKQADGVYRSRGYYCGGCLMFMYL